MFCLWNWRLGLIERAMLIHLKHVFRVDVGLRFALILQHLTFYSGFIVFFMVTQIVSVRSRGVRFFDFIRTCVCVVDAFFQTNIVASCVWAAKTSNNVEYGPGCSPLRNCSPPSTFRPRLGKLRSSQPTSQPASQPEQSWVNPASQKQSWVNYVPTKVG